MRTCPNGKCRRQHEDHVGQCPECGAPMSRTPDAVMDVNTHLYQLRANAGQAHYSGGPGRSPSSEPFYPDTLAVMETARQVVAELMEVAGEADPDV